MKHSSRYHAMAKNDLLDSYGILHPLGREPIYPCKHCGRDTVLKKGRVLYCFMCSRGHLHPKYNFILDHVV